MTHNDDTPLEAGLKALSEMKDNPNERNPIKRLTDATNILSLGIREINFAVESLRNKEIH